MQMVQWRVNGTFVKKGIWRRRLRFLKGWGRGMWRARMRWLRGLRKLGGMWRRSGFFTRCIVQGFVRMSLRLAGGVASAGCDLDYTVYHGLIQGTFVQIF
jgi:hypothetical protein